MDFVEKFVDQASGFSSPLSMVICGACLILATCVLPVFRMRSNHLTIGPECRQDEPLDGRECVVLLATARGFDGVLADDTKHAHTSRMGLPVHEESSTCPAPQILWYVGLG